MYVLFFGLHVTNNLQVYNLQLVYNVTCLQFTSLHFTTCLFLGIDVNAHVLSYICLQNLHLNTNDIF